RGVCRPGPHLEQAVEKMQQARSEMYELATGVAGMNENNQRKVTRFLDSFFATLDDDARFQRDIAGACRG
ncbi:MAG: hypothetical protein OES38_14175, partial [Gammaproteobacteria bacterium]|nr:hypothetical protein [Gammaproteobacteria bacterium]